MPTSSQAMIVMTGEGEDPRIPRRRYSNTTANRISVKSYDMDKAVRCTVGVNPYGAASSGRSTSAVFRPQGTIQNDCLPQIRTEKKGTQSNTMLRHLQTSNKAYTQGRDLESLGFRRRRVGTSGQTTLVPVKPVGSGRASPPNTAHRQSARRGNVAQSSGESAGVMKTDSEEITRHEEPKLSLLDDIKRTVHYDNRIQPAMHMRKRLPPSNPFAVCLSFREGDEFSHKEVKDLLEANIGLKVRSVQYDPVSVRSPDTSADTRSRWIISYATPTECEFAVSKGLELEGDKIAIKFLDDVMMYEYEAYNILLDEVRKAETAQQLTRRQGPVKKRNPKRRL